MLSTMEAAIAPVRILRQVFIAVVPLDSLSSWMGRPVKILMSARPAMEVVIISAKTPWAVLTAAAKRDLNY